MADQIPEHLAITPSRQVRLRYTGDGSTGAVGFPANPGEPEFESHVTDAELDALLRTGLYEQVTGVELTGHEGIAVYEADDDDEKED